MHRCSPLTGKVLGLGEPRKLFDISLRPPQLLHALVDGVRLNRIIGVVRYLRRSPASEFVGLLADQFTALLVDIFPAEYLLGGVADQSGTAKDFFWHKSKTLQKAAVVDPESPPMKAGSRIQGTGR